ncbi:hypothetical protein CPB86DRAFT_878841 [Serendipita vermifera]|nr:hypothetical protein CPB86DRAFT_878841 [Serendipita vermifera]
MSSHLHKLLWQATPRLLRQSQMAQGGLWSGYLIVLAASGLVDLSSAARTSRGTSKYMDL